MQNETAQARFQPQYFRSWARLYGQSSARRSPERNASASNSSVFYDQLQADDTVVWKLDRLARSTRDLLEIMKVIHASGAALRLLSEPWADTTTHAGKMILMVFAGIAEFERDLIRERTGAGRVMAKANGVRFGRPRKLNIEQRALALRLLREGRSPGEVAKTFRVHGVHDLPAGGSRGRNHALSAFSVPLRPKPHSH
jgi:hypothetical protein